MKRDVAAAVLLELLLPQFCIFVYMPVNVCESCQEQRYGSLETLFKPFSASY